MQEMLAFIWFEYVEHQKNRSSLIKRISEELRQNREDDEKNYRDLLESISPYKQAFERAKASLSDPRNSSDDNRRSQALYERLNNLITSELGEVNKSRQDTLADFQKIEEGLQAQRTSQMKDRLGWESFVQSHYPGVTVRWFSDSDVLNCETSNGFLFLEDGSVQEKPKSVC